MMEDIKGDDLNEKRKRPDLARYNRKFKSAQMKKQWKNPTYRQIWVKRMTLHNPMSNPIYRKKVSDAKFKNNAVKRPEVRQKLREKALLQNLTFPRSNTSIELILQKELKERGIKFKTQKPISKIAKPDIFIEPNICIFADGDYWHNLPNMKRKDIKVNKILSTNGFQVMRFWEHEIKNNIEVVMNEISSKMF